MESPTVDTVGEGHLGFDPVAGGVLVHMDDVPDDLEGRIGEVDDRVQDDGKSSGRGWATRSRPARVGDLRRVDVVISPILPPQSDPSDPA